MISSTFVLPEADERVPGFQRKQFSSCFGLLYSLILFNKKQISYKHLKMLPLQLFNVLQGIISDFALGCCRLLFSLCENVLVPCKNKAKQQKGRAGTGEGGYTCKFWVHCFIAYEEDSYKERWDRIYQPRRESHSETLVYIGICIENSNLEGCSLLTLGLVFPPG